MARPTNLTLCSFCGKSHAEVRKLIAGPGVYICDNCVVLCKSVLDKEFATKKHRPKVNVPKPAEIKRQLDLQCIGQDHAKKTLAVAVHNHYKRILQEPQDADAGRGSGPRPKCRGPNREEQYSHGRPDGVRQDTTRAVAGANPRRALRDRGCHHAHGGRLRGRGRREHHPAPASERRLRCETRATGDRLH